MIESIPEDGGDDEKFSSKKEVDDAMREGEAAFTKNDMPKALEMYQRALMLDPKMYEAALYTGDVYFKTADQKKGRMVRARCRHQSRSRDRLPLLGRLTDEAGARHGSGR